jgi:hypothetical protein
MRGLGVFRQHFAGYEDYYVLIGGTACTVLMEDAGIEFRATKDLDIVLIMECIDGRFAEKSWTFIESGGYQTHCQGEERSRFYRFEKPQNLEYPAMIELFSRAPDNFELKAGCHLLPLHISDDLSSLSAILLNEDYYGFLRGGRRMINGLSILDELHLIPFKAKAWCELTDRRNAGEEGLSKHIKKHVKDIAVLLTLTDDRKHVSLAAGVLKDMERFVSAMEHETIDQHTTGIKGMTTDLYCKQLKKIYIIQ